MPVYVMLTRLTDQGAKTVKTNPERIVEVDDQLRDMGLKVLNQYVTLGRYDFVNIVEAPDEETIARVGIELASRGSIRIETLAALPLDQFVGSMKQRAMSTAGSR